MKIHTLQKILFVLYAALIFSSCSKPVTPVTPPVTPPITTNNPPVARAGADQTIMLPTNATIIDGSSSYDPDGSTISYSWRQITGPNQSVFSILYRASNPEASKVVNNLIVGSYGFELKVTDNGGLSAKDTLLIDVLAGVLSGSEFIFDSLPWELNFDGDGSELKTPARSDLFQNTVGAYYNNNFPGDVYLKFDTAATWLKVNKGYNLGLPVQYVFHVQYPHLWVTVYPAHYHLHGRKASIKVIFW